MADARKLMQAAKASSASKITDKLARYADGILSCVLCNVVVKSDSLWVPHLASKVRSCVIVRKALYIAVYLFIYLPIKHLIMEHCLSQYNCFCNSTLFLALMVEISYPYFVGPQRSIGCGQRTTEPKA
jgi:hypothetical protein